MKKVPILFTLIIVFLMSWNNVNAQTFTCTIQNQTVVGNQFRFDIFVQTTSGSFFLGNGDFVVTFNNANFTSPTVTRSLNPIFIAGAGDGIVYSSGVSIVSSNRIILNLNAPLWEDQSLFDLYVVQPSTTAPGTRIATITVNNITTPAGTANIQWRTIAPNNTAISNTTNSNPWNMTNITVNGTFTNPPDSPLPVELTSFTSKIINDKVQLNWSTKTETNNFGFDVERKVNGDWQKIGFVNGNGNSNSPKEYTYTDKNLIGGSKFLYRLKQVDNDGQFEYTDAVEVEVIPNKFELSQNYPNPFNPGTKIRYQLPKESKVVIKIYNILGSEIMELLNEQKEAGIYEVEFKADNLSSGTYIYKINTDNFVQTKKMILLK